MGLLSDLLWPLLRLARRLGFSRCFGSNPFRHKNVSALTSCATRNSLLAFPSFRKLSGAHLLVEKAVWWSCTLRTWTSHERGERRTGQPRGDHSPGIATDNVG